MYYKLNKEMKCTRLRGYIYIYKRAYIVFYYTGRLQATKLNVLYTGSFFQVCTQLEKYLRYTSLNT